jgi:alkaline phosphatase
MGPELMGFFMQGVRYGNVASYPQKISHLEKLTQEGQVGMYFNNTYDTVVTDSAAAATQMATGVVSRPGIIGQDHNNQNVPTLLELAKKKGKSVGVITDAYVTDATPAGFSAHVADRGEKREIARQQIDLGVDVISGGGLKYFSTEENKDLLLYAKEQGYTVVHNKQELEQVKKGKLLGLYSQEALPMSIEMRYYPHLPSLTDQVKESIKLLEKNKKGFVLMVEAGKIDWAAHGNDAGSVWAEMKVFDQVLGYIKKYADKHPDTLVYVNADHGTGLGGFTYQHLSTDQAKRKTDQGEMLYWGDTDYASFKQYELFEKQTRTLYSVQEELKRIPLHEFTLSIIQEKLSEVLGYPVDISGFTNLQDIEGLFRQLDLSRGIVWATQGHSSVMLLSIAYGPESDKFTGLYHNTDILPRMLEALGWDKE